MLTLTLTLTLSKRNAVPVYTDAYGVYTDAIGKLQSSQRRFNNYLAIAII